VNATTTPQECAAEIDRQIAEYDCLSSDATENVEDELTLTIGRPAAHALVLSSFRYRTR